MGRFDVSKVDILSLCISAESLQYTFTYIGIFHLDLKANGLAYLPY